MRIIIIGLLTGFAFAVPTVDQLCGISNTQRQKHIPSVVRVTGTVTFVDAKEVPAANHMPVWFQRTDCSACVVGVDTDSEGKYEITLSPGKYRLIIKNPSPPIQDLLADGQDKYLLLTGFVGEKKVSFDIKLKIPKMTRSN